MTTKVNQTCWKCSRTCSHGRVGPCLLPVRWLPLSLLMLFSITLTSGCATYIRDRVADAGDIFNVTVGEGLGVTAKAGPVHTGLGYCKDYYGLRCGEIIKPDWEWSCWDYGKYQSWDMALVIFASSGFVPNECNNLPKRAEARWKTFQSEWLDWNVGGGFTPFLDFPLGQYVVKCSPSQLAQFGLDDGVSLKVKTSCLPQMTQLDLTIGVGVSIRLGFNPGELLDFALGFVGLDLYDDDVAGAKEEEQEKY